MKLERILFQPKAQLIFTQEEVILMMRCAESHYDGRCREVGQVGGFLYGMNNVYVLREPLAIAASGEHFTLVFDEIDTLCKILEIVRNESEEMLARQLRTTLHNILQQLNFLSNLEATDTSKYRVSWNF